MLNARNVVLLIVLIAVISIIATIVEMAQPPDGGGQRSDSYGTTATGYRALFEILNELKIPVQHGLVPPTNFKQKDACVVFLNPDADIVEIEPGYLKQMGDWVRDGGKVIVAGGETEQSIIAMPRRGAPSATRRTIYSELGLEEIESKPSLLIVPNAKTPGATQTIGVSADGDLAFLNNLTKKIVAPCVKFQELDLSGKTKINGKVYSTESDGSQHVFAASYPLGKGEVLVVGDASLLTNSVIAREDNAVLAAHLFNRMGREFVFDEFYHGLTIRGQPAWLLTRHPFGLLTALLVLATLLWAWREAINLGPVLPDKAANRRSIGEYADAMANLFNRENCRQYILRELKDGVLWSLSRRLRLKPGSENVEAVAAALARKDPAAAEALREAEAEIDCLIGLKLPPSELSALKAARQIEKCL